MPRSSPSPSPCPSYLDLLTPDDAIDRAAFEAILQRRIAAEIDLRLCVAARLHAPSELSLGDIRAWRRVAARRLDPALVPPDERARIAQQERAALTDWAATMQRGAAAQREVMERAGAAGEWLQAAE
jgi:hypothetical protein